MKKILVIVVTSALLLSAGCSGKETPANTAPVESPQEDQTIDTFGIVKSNDVKDILISFPAIVEKVHVKEGQTVKKGDVLFTLNYDEFSNQIKSKNIELETTKHEYKNDSAEKNNITLELDKLNKDLARVKGYLEKKSDPDLSKLLNDLKNAEKVYKDSLEELKSKESLLKSGSISQTDYDSFKKSVDSDQKSVYDIKSSIEKATLDLQKEIDQLKFQISQKSSSLSGSDKSGIYQGKISTLENEIALLNSKLNKSYINENNIISDVDNGIVYNLGYVKGEAVDSNKKLLSIMDTNSIIVESNVPEEFIKDVKTGSTVTIIPQADKSKKYTGKITYIANKAIQQNGETTVLVQTSIDNNDGFLLPDFNVDLEISMAK